MIIKKLYLGLFCLAAASTACAGNIHGVQFWGGYGYGALTTKAPSNGFTRKIQHHSWGLGLQYLYALNNNVSLGGGLSYFEPGKVTISNANYRWAYQGHSMPIELLAAYKLQPNIQIQLGAGMAYTRQKLSMITYNAPIIPITPTDITGETTAWKPVVSLGLTYTFSSGVGLGVRGNRVFASTPKALNNNTTALPDDKAYRTLGSQTNIVAALSYSF